MGGANYLTWSSAWGQLDLPNDAFPPDPPAPNPVEIQHSVPPAADSRQLTFDVEKLAKAETQTEACDCCGSTSFVDVPIHEGRSVRCDCALCHRTAGFPVWYAEGSSAEIGRAELT
jgi:hypothetical protein